MSSTTWDMATTARSTTTRRPAAGPITITRVAPSYYAPLARMAWVTTRVLDPRLGVTSVTQRVKLA
jgi:hypothetical protein